MKLKRIWCDLLHVSILVAAFVMDDIEVLGQNMIKIEEVKLEPDGEAEEQVWDYAGGEMADNWKRKVKEEDKEGGDMADSLKREIKKEDEEGELEPPFRVYLSEQVKEEHEDPLATDSEDTHVESKRSVGGEDTPSGLRTGGGSSVGRGGECHEGDDSTLEKSEVAPKERAARRYSAEDGPHFPKPKESRSQDEHSVCDNGELASQREVKIMRKGKRSHYCPLCEKPFNYRCLLKIHMRVHSGKRPFKCSNCQMAFIRKGCLGKHMRIHSGDRPFECSICHKTFSRKDYLVAHFRIHSGERPFECSICHKTCAQKSNLDVHMRIHSGERPFECSICHKTCARKSNLAVHMRIHNDKRPFDSSIYQAFMRKGNRVEHKPVHRGECSICRKTFRGKFSLKEHWRIHNGERPFKCSNCQSAFSKKRSLVEHYHYCGERPFECSICQKSFQWKGTLNEHMRIHSGERPFECSFCQKTFAWKISLDAHMRIHSGERPF